MPTFLAKYNIRIVNEAIRIDEDWDANGGQSGKTYTEYPRRSIAVRRENADLVLLIPFMYLGNKPPISRIPMDDTQNYYENSENIESTFNAISSLCNQS